MTHPIDTAYVDIVPVDKSLQKLQRDIDKAMDKVEKDIQKDLDKIDDDFAKTMADIDKHFFLMNKDAQKRFKDLEKTVSDTLEVVADDFDVTFTEVRHHFIALGDESDRSFKKMHSRFLMPLSDGLKNIGGVVSDLGRAMFQLVSGIGGSIASNPLMALVLLLTPAVIALAAALSQLIGIVGLIPAGFGVLLSIILPLVVAFQNFGDAVSAVASGDLEKIDEAMKKLSPSAQSVAREIGALMPMFRSFQRLIQEGFFAPLVGDFMNVTRTLMPTLEKGFFGIAQALGRMVSSFAELAASKTTIETLQKLFASTEKVLVTLTGPLVRFTDALLNTIPKALPFVERIAAAFGRALDSFSAFINKSVETGDFDKFLEDAITTIKELIDLGKALGGLIGTIFAGTEDSGHEFIKTLTELTVKLNDFLKTADGKAALDALVFAVQFLAASLETAIAIFIVSWISLRRMLGMFETIGRAVVGFVGMIIEWIGKVPAAVTEFIGSLPERVAGFFTRMFDMALQAIGIGIGLILFAIQVLPGKIADFLVALPQRIYDIMVKIGPLVATALQTAVDFGRDVVVNGFNAIVDFVLSVPERIRNLIPNFGSAGKSLIESFMNGFRAVGTFVGDIAGDIVGAVKGFLNKAIDKINQGIAKVDLVLPGDMGRIPRLEHGALVRHRPGGILANIGEGDEDEVVAPLSKLEGMIKGGSTVNIAAGAINLNFSGALPTDSEARRVGEAVGMGIMSRIAQRNLQTSVRAI